MNYSSFKYVWILIIDSSGDSTDHTTPTGAGDTIKVKKSETYGVFNNDAMTTEDIYSYPHKHDPRNQVIQNDTYTPEQPVTTAINESYNYQDKYDPSNTIETKQNKAYAVSITTEKNEAYKLVSGTCDEYDYI